MKKKRKDKAKYEIGITFKLTEREKDIWLASFGKFAPCSRGLEMEWDEAGQRLTFVFGNRPIEDWLPPPEKD